MFIIVDNINKNAYKPLNNTFPMTKQYGDVKLVGNLYGVNSLIKKVGPTNATVLITGESGTGKELVAKAIHNISTRSNKDIVIVPCGALPGFALESTLFGHIKGSYTGANYTRKGKFELASGSTIFLDEIGEMPLELQVKLLRVLQEKEYESLGSDDVKKTDARVITATNRDLHDMVHEGNFRLDLFYRIDVANIHVPPLRDRKDDIYELTDFFIKKYLKKDKGYFGEVYITSESEDDTPGLGVVIVKPDFREALTNYNWPGNVRELENAIENAVVMMNDDSLLKTEYLRNRVLQGLDITESKVISVIPSSADHLVKNKLTLAEFEHQIIKEVYIKMGENKTRTAELLGISRHTLTKRLEK